MSKRAKLRIVSLVMFVAAVIFVICAMCCPTCGRVIYIGDLAIGGEVWRKLYLLYGIVMVSLFVASFFAEKPKKQQKKEKKY